MENDWVLRTTGAKAREIVFKSADDVDSQYLVGTIDLRLKNWLATWFERRPETWITVSGGAGAKAAGIELSCAVAYSDQGKPTREARDYTTWGFLKPEEEPEVKESWLHFQLIAIDGPAGIDFMAVESFNGKDVDGGFEAHGTTPGGALRALAEVVERDLSVAGWKARVSQ